MPRAKNETDYTALRRAKKPLLGIDSHGAPWLEARALLYLVRSGTLTRAEARELIEIPERTLRVLVDLGVPGNVIQGAAQFRRAVLASFDDLYPCAEKILVPSSRRRRRPVKIIDMLGGSWTWPGGNQLRHASLTEA